MRKSFLAVAAMLSTAVAAHAQSTVTIYGFVSKRTKLYTTFANDSKLSSNK